MHKKALSETQLLEKAMHFCAYQERCEHEVRIKLKALGANSTLINAIIVKLETEQFLNEERFVELYVKSKFKHNKWGKQKIKAHLAQKGISGTTVTHALNNLSAENYQEMVNQLALYHLTDTSFEAKTKTIRYLQSKGFEYAVIEPAIQLAEQQQKQRHDS